MAKLEILVGADPEVFMRRAGKKRFTSAHGAVPGTKEKPFKVDKGAVQVDGMALEFNIDPAKNKQEFIGNLQAVMGQLGGMVKGYDLIATPTAHFTRVHMARQPKEALELGCEPDFNAWGNGAVNPKPNGDRPMRTGAGHVHIGWTNDVDINHPEHLEACMLLTRQLDYYLGVGSMLYDDDKERRTMYGDVGCFRPKPYGVEYRVLSNKWLSSPELMGWVYDRVVQAVDALMDGRRAEERVGGAALKRLIRGQMRPGEAIDYIDHFMNVLDIPRPPRG